MTLFTWRKGKREGFTQFYFGKWKSMERAGSTDLGEKRRKKEGENVASLLFLRIEKARKGPVLPQERGGTNFASSDAEEEEKCREEERKQNLVSRQERPVPTVVRDP